MTTFPDTHQIEDYRAQLELQSVDYHVALISLESRIQFLEEENARLQETLHFILEICCYDE
ncbi:MAG: hypothetical protein A2W33_01875 [Chloroflexi bacterium RBG_16_52_11]|nr:MAG: hypothetical protein A2W33_01875 [Chloroflexi bacterium RBG_16_52_11]